MNWYTAVKLKKTPAPGGVGAIVESLSDPNLLHFSFVLRVQNTVLLLLSYPPLDSPFEKKIQAVAALHSKLTAAHLSPSPIKRDIFEKESKRRRNVNAYLYK